MFSVGKLVSDHHPYVAKSLLLVVANARNASRWKKEKMDNRSIYRFRIMMCIMDSHTEKLLQVYQNMHDIPTTSNR
jgi:hypothetical protein